jgi:hypothetical protein
MPRMKVKVFSPLWLEYSEAGDGIMDIYDCVIGVTTAGDLKDMIKRQFRNAWGANYVDNNQSGMMLEHENMLLFTMSRFNEHTMGSRPSYPGEYLGLIHDHELVNDVINEFETFFVGFWNPLTEAPVGLFGIPRDYVVVPRSQVIGPIRPPVSERPGAGPPRWLTRPLHHSGNTPLAQRTQGLGRSVDNSGDWARGSRDVVAAGMPYGNDPAMVPMKSQNHPKQSKPRLKWSAEMVRYLNQSTRDLVGPWQEKCHEFEQYRRQHREDKVARLLKEVGIAKPSIGFDSMPFPWSEVRKRMEDRFGGGPLTRSEMQNASERVPNPHFGSKTYARDKITAMHKAWSEGQDALTVHCNGDSGLVKTISRDMTDKIQLIFHPRPVPYVGQGATQGATASDPTAKKGSGRPRKTVSPALSKGAGSSQRERVYLSDDDVPMTQEIGASPVVKRKKGVRSSPLAVRRKMPGRPGKVQPSFPSPVRKAPKRTR